MADVRITVFSVTMFFVILSFIFLRGTCEEQVPIILWSSEGSHLLHQTPPAAGHVVSSLQLETYLNRALSMSPQNVLLFLQDKLSVDDFTMYGGTFGNKQDSAFPNLEAALQSSPCSLVLPAVQLLASSALIELLKEQLDSAPLYMDPETLSQLRLNASISALLVFRLPYSSGANMMSAKETLSGNDEVIGQVLSIMNSQSVPYTAVYTSLQPSRLMEEETEGFRSIGRSLLQESRGPYPPVDFKKGGTTCILFWAENLKVSQLRSQWDMHDLSSVTFGEGVNPKLEGSFCNESHSRLVLNYEDILGYKNFKLIFAMSQRHYKVSARRWFTLDTVELEYNGQKATFNGSRNVYAPAEYSYRCESVTSHRYPILTPRSSKDNATQWRVSFENFQIQGFNVMDNEFSYASDCASFFTSGIWMGLITSVLMLLVLTYGLHMIMQLHTMDRFDDPKGPTISVPQTE